MCELVVTEDYEMRSDLSKILASAVAGMRCRFATVRSSNFTVFASNSTCSMALPRSYNPFSRQLGCQFA